jgi:hypothetical protein
MFGLMCSHREDGGGKRERYTDYVVEASMHVPLRLHNHLGKNKEMALAKTNSPENRNQLQPSDWTVVCQCAKKWNDSGQRLRLILRGENECRGEV